MNVQKADMLAKLDIHWITSNSEAVIEKRLTADNRIEKSIKQLSRSKEVLLCGKLVNPTVTCLKSICIDTAARYKTIPLVVRFGQDVQKFKLPFRLTDEDALETDYEFIFIKSVKPANAPPDSQEHLQFSVFECMTFFCLPAVLKVSAKQPATLTVQLNLNMEKLAKLPPHLLTMQLTKLLVARIKGTNMLQSFYVTINLVEIPQFILDRE